MNKEQEVSTPVSILVYTLLIAVFLVIGRGHSFASSHCHPLLLMIEGGNEGPGKGAAIEDFLPLVQPEYNRKGITVLPVDNDQFWYGANYQVEEAEEFVKHIRASGFSPIVIVGHSLGAGTAWSLAKRLPATLLVTLDGVSYTGNTLFFGSTLSHPGSPTKWRNVIATKKYVPIFSDILRPLNLPYWYTAWNADINYGTSEAGHYDVEEMFKYNHRGYGSAKAAVDRALKCPPGGNFRTPRPKELCKFKGVGCEVSWYFINECYSTINFRFVELDNISGHNVNHWPADGYYYQLPHDESRGFGPFPCRSPGIKGLRVGAI